MVTTVISSEGAVVLPSQVRSKLHLEPGAKLRCEILGDSVILTPDTPPRPPREYVINPLTGLRVTKRQKGSKPLTTEMVKDYLADFP
jgi:AbrB family looped-hinge helix DNA binding protein